MPSQYWARAPPLSFWVALLLCSSLLWPSRSILFTPVGCGLTSPEPRQVQFDMKESCLYVYVYLRKR